MSKKIYNKLMKQIEEGFGMDNECLEEEIIKDTIEYYFLNNKITNAEYLELIRHVDFEFNRIDDSIWEAMCLCNPDLCD